MPMLLTSEEILLALGLPDVTSTQELNIDRLVHHAVNNVYVCSN